MPINGINRKKNVKYKLSYKFVKWYNKLIENERSLSLDKIKSTDIKALEHFTKKHSGQFVISDKLFGNIVFH